MQKHPRLQAAHEGSPAPVNISTSVGPILKWPGGKAQLLPTLRELLPAGNRLIEPFLGGASVFLGTDYSSYLLLDAHIDLIGMYKQVVQRPERIIELARPLFSEHAANEDIYLAVRDAFNRAAPADVRAAYFLYLNKFGFNGLSRYSAKGNFNVPWGRAAQAPTLPEDSIRAFSERARSNAVIVQGDFTDAFKLAVPGDVIYCDPPYVDLDDAPSFTKYTAEGFPRERQQELADCARAAAARGIPVVISNHLTAKTRELYRDAECHKVEVRRSVAAQANSRKMVAEGIFVFNP
ncbi:DNA adenine methylase [Cupriavidus sp. 8B]